MTDRSPARFRCPRAASRSYDLGRGHVNTLCCSISVKVPSIRVTSSPAAVRNRYFDTLDRTVDIVIKRERERQRERERERERGLQNAVSPSLCSRTVCLKSIANTSQAVPGSLRFPGHRFQRLSLEGQMQWGREGAWLTQRAGMDKDAETTLKWGGSLLVA